MLWTLLEIHLKKNPSAALGAALGLQLQAWREGVAQDDLVGVAEQRSPQAEVEARVHIFPHRHDGPGYVPAAGLDIEAVQIRLLGFPASLR